ncbi:hypothetical protein FRC09_000459 [Ceratobasidium sp. 395]|nr:hypothetical protein FRC09_000459 [Ceratobasidium sp. 395]
MQQDEELHRTYMMHILNGLQYLHTRISPVPHGDLTPKNILVDANGNLRLTSISFARLSLDLASEHRARLFEGDTPSARYMSPELLQDEASPTPESDMWAFGNVAFWIFSGLEPYSEHKNEIEVVAQITRGIPPNGPDQLAKLGDLDETPIPDDSLWQTNGTWESISRCWSVVTKHRPTATQFLDDLENQSNMSERSGVFDHWNISGIKDLTGRIKKSETTNYGLSLAWSREANTTDEVLEQHISRYGAGRPPYLKASSDLALTLLSKASN